MRTFFNIVLGILVTVLKACLHALVSMAGVIGVGALVVLAGVYAWRRLSRTKSGPAESADIVPIDR